MTNGKNYAYDWLSLQVASVLDSFTYSGVPSWLTYGRYHSGVLQTGYTPNAIDVNAGITLAAYSEPTAWHIFYDGPNAPSGGYTYSGTGTMGTVTAKVRLVDLKIYATLYTKWRAVCSSIEIYANGSLVQTLAGFDSTSDGFNPCFLPVLGVFPIITPDCSVLTDGGPSAPYSNYDYTLDAESHAIGGWQFSRNSEIVTPELSVLAYTLPAVPSGFSYSATPASVSGTTTFNASASHRSYKQVIGSWCKSTVSELTEYHYTDERASWIMAAPSNDKYFTRLYGADFVQLWARSGTPKTTVKTDRAVGEWPSTLGGDVPPKGQTYVGQSTSTIVVHARNTDMLSTVAGASHSIEGPMDYVFYAPFWATGEKEQRQQATVTYGLDSGLPWCPVSTGWPNAKSASATAEFPYSVDSTTENSQLANYLHHANKLVRYINYLQNPAWCYDPWYSPDSTAETLQAWEWPVDGNRANASEYWAQIAVQWCHRPSLPSGEDRRTRLFNVSDCLYKSGHRPFVKAFVTGQETSWLGIRNFQTEALNLPESRQYSSASESLWTFTNCTASFGSRLTLTPTGGATTIKAKLQIGSWTGENAMYGHISDRLKLDWVSTNVTQVRGYMKSIDGTSRALVEHVAGDGYTAKGEICAIPHGTDTKYAGSHAQDYGCGVVTDTGTDLIPAKGISAATMADPERSMAFMLLGSGTARYLEIEIDCTGTVQIEYPTFYASNEGWSLFQETSFNQILIRANGPGLRIGGLTWSDGNTLLTTPVVKELPDRMTVVDALCTMRALRGDDPTAGVTTQLSSLYDSYEGQSVSNAGAITAYSLILPIHADGQPIFAYVNTYSEVPAIGYTPLKALNPVTWDRDGDLAYEAGVWSEEKRYLVNGGTVPVHVRIGTDQWTSVSYRSLPGWQITEHAHEVDNTESCEICAGDAAIASARPWWGWLFAYAIEAISSHGLDICADPIGNFYAIYVLDGGLRIWRFNLAAMSEIMSVIDGDSIVHGNIAWHPEGCLKVVYESGGILYEIENWAYGNASQWSSPMSIGAGTLGAFRIDKTNGVEYDIYHDGSAFKCRRLAPGGSWTECGTIVAAESGPCGLDVGSDEQHSLVAVIDDAGTKRRFLSISQGDLWEET